MVSLNTIVLSSIFIPHKKTFPGQPWGGNSIHNAIGGIYVGNVGILGNVGIVGIMGIMGVVIAMLCRILCQYRHMLDKQL